jgi:hypothetical protein
MDLESVPSRVAVVVAVLATLPALAFAIGKGSLYAGAVTMINVLLISACIYLFMSPHEEEPGHPA